MKWETIILDLSVAEIQGLKKINSKLIQHLEKGLPLKLDVLNGLKDALTKIINKNNDFRRIMEATRQSQEHYVVRLTHDDHEILNLPWGMAVEEKSGRELGNTERLYLTKSRTEFLKKDDYAPRAAGPLKVLVMIASPEDPELKGRLNYEEEEFEILRSFTPLLQTGEVQIDFTDDGSLEALRSKLNVNKYHLLHFSGHGVFQDGQGYLILENPLNLKTQPTTAAEFAGTLSCNPDHQVPLVLLTSCQTAQETTEKGLRGVAGQLLQAGVPAVIAMGMSIRDRYAVAFSAHFYQELARKQKIPMAFQTAIRRLQEVELENNRQNPATQDQIPLQWIIPNLYLRSPMENLVEWKRKREEITTDSYRFLIEQDRLILKHDPNYRFIGRRYNKAAILTPFFNKTPILLRGQGGIGKTALAEHLVQRLIAQEPSTQPFIFTEKIRSLQEIIDSLKNYLVNEKNQNGVHLTLASLEKASKQAQFLCSKLTEVCRPVFVFDNLETFQSEPGQAFAPQYQDLAEFITYLCRSGEYHLILTCRYPVEFEKVQSFELDQVSRNDFWKKCATLALHRIQTDILQRALVSIQTGTPGKRPVAFYDLVELLYGIFGGNYRALEFFDQLYIQDPGIITESLHDLKLFRQKIAEESKKVTGLMSENLVFAKLLSLLDQDCRNVLRLLAHFRIPVQTLAVRMQLMAKQNRKLTKTWETLNNLTLIEISLDRELNRIYYYVTPLVKELLGSGKLTGDKLQFSAQKAGLYHYHIWENIERSLTDLAEAFEWLYQVPDRDKVNDVGEKLSKVYYQSSMFQNALYYCQKVYQLLGDDTEISILNHMGLIFRIFGRHDLAINFFQITLLYYQRTGDKRGETTALKNISVIYRGKGDYDTALGYLKQSLRISQEIGDKRGEGVALSSIGAIYFLWCDYDTALGYLKQSLPICQEIGDKGTEWRTLGNIAGIYAECGAYDTALGYMEQSLRIIQEIGDKSDEWRQINNIAEIHLERGDYNTALGYFERSLRISQEIGEKSGEARTLNNIGRIYNAKGDYDNALRYLEQSLRISQEITDKCCEGRALKSIGENYLARGDYDNALGYFEQSLRISQEIGEKSSEGKILNNIGEIYSARGDYDNALRVSKQGLRISQEIGDKRGEGQTLNNIGQIYNARGDYDNTLGYFEQSLRISQEIGNKSGMSTTFHNLALLYLIKDDLQKYWEYENSAYSLALETEDAISIYQVGKILGQELCKAGAAEKGIPMLQRCMEIGETARYQDVGEIVEVLRQYQNKV